MWEEILLVDTRNGNVVRLYLHNVSENDETYRSFRFISMLLRLVQQRILNPRAEIFYSGIDFMYK